MKITLPTNLTGAIQSADYRKLDDGKIWFGQADKDPRSYPIDTFLDKAMTIPAPPFFWLKMGYVSHNGQVVDVYVADDVESVSILITDVYNRQLMYLNAHSVVPSCDIVLPPPPTDDGKDKLDDDECLCVLPPVAIYFCQKDEKVAPPPADDDAPPSVPPADPTSPPLNDDGKPPTVITHRVGFFATREFGLESWQNYLENDEPPSKDRWSGNPILDKYFFINPNFDEIAEKLAQYTYFNIFRDYIRKSQLSVAPDNIWDSQYNEYMISVPVGKPVLWITDGITSYANKDMKGYDGFLKLDEMVEVTLPNAGYFGGINTDIIKVVENSQKQATNLRYIGKPPEHSNQQQGNTQYSYIDLIIPVAEKMSLPKPLNVLSIGFIQEMRAISSGHKYYLSQSYPIYPQTIEHISPKVSDRLNDTLKKLNLE